jgi:protein TonB
LSLGLHAGLLVAFIGIIANGATYEAGSGDDAFVVEQGIALQGIAKLGDELEMLEVAEVPPVQEATEPKPIEEVEPELTDLVTATDSPFEEQAVVEEPKPVEEEKPEDVPTQAQAQQIARVNEMSSGAEQRGGDSSMQLAYLGTLSKTLERFKVNPRSKLSGTVLVRFTVGPKGEILSHEIQKSSGSKLLDDAAIAALERASPFPPMPTELAGGPLEVQVPFKFVTR